MPVDMEGLGRVVRSADAVRDGTLLQVLLHLKAEENWELSIALTSLLEAAHVAGESKPWEEAEISDREVLGYYADDEDAEDAEFRRMVRSSSSYAGFDDNAIEVEDEFEEVDGDVKAVSVDALAEIGHEPADSESGGAHPMDALLGLDAPPASPWNTNLAVDTAHYNVVLACIAKARKWQEALDLLLRMRSRGVPRDTVTYNTVLNALSRGKRWKLALRVFKNMQSEGVPPTTVTFASVISATSQAGEWQRALSLLELAFETQTPRNTIVYSSAISACDKAGEWRTALDLLKRMEGDNVVADATVLNAAMSACSRAGEHEEAEKVLRTAFPQHGVEPDTYSYNALLSALSRSQAKAAEADGASATTDASAVVPKMQALIDEMVAAGLQPDRFSYNPIINAMGRAGDPEGAVRVLRELQASPKPLDVVSYTSAISACEGHWEDAVGLLEEMLEDEDVVIDAIPFSRVLVALRRAGQWERACSLLADVSSRGVSHNPMMTNTLLETCADVADAEAVDNRDTAIAAAAAGIEQLQDILEVTAKAQAAALGPQRLGAPRRPPTDRQTAALVRRLLVHAPVEAVEEPLLLEAVERATLRVARQSKSRSRGRGRGRGRGRSGRGNRAAERVPARGRLPNGAREYF